MYELRQVGERTYYLDCPTRVGIFHHGDRDVCLIDSGSDKSVGRKLQVILEAQGWNLTAIFNTHSHADHIGGNNLLQSRLGCPIYAPMSEMAFVTAPELESSVLFGGFGHKGLRNKFFRAQPSTCGLLTPEILPEGLTYTHIDGHASTQVAFHTCDDVWFLADGVVAQDTLEKYGATYTYDVENFLKSLDIIEGLEGKLFIPAHAEPVADIKPLVAANRKAAQDFIQVVLQSCQTPTCFDYLLKSVFEALHMDLTIGQHALIGSTTRSYLSYLLDTHQVKPRIENNLMVWEAIPPTIEPIP